MFYNHADFVYNISMVVNKEKPIDKLRNILKDQNGILFTSDLEKHGIARTYLSILEKNGEIQRISRGIYAATNSLVDEMVLFQARYKKAIFSHETALYLHGLTDRTPLYYSVTVPSGYNQTSLEVSGAKVFFINNDLHPVGLVTVKSPHRNEVETYNPERTICDILRSRNKIEAGFINESLKNYVLDKSKNIPLLHNYAKLFGIQTIVRNYIEVLL